MKTEADLYRRLGLPWLPPEVREDEGEVEAAAEGDTFADLLTEGDIKGLVHCHTVYSDGKHTVEQMARAAEAMGMRYITITDHSPTAHYAGGLPLDRLKRQWDEIAKAQDAAFQENMRNDKSGQWYKEHLPVAMRNLKRIHDAGVPVVIAGLFMPVTRRRGTIAIVALMVIDIAINFLIPGYAMFLVVVCEIGVAVLIAVTVVIQKGLCGTFSMKSDIFLMTLFES